MQKLALLFFMLLAINSMGQKILLVYGSENRFLINSDSTYLTGTVNLEIADYTFSFDNKEFENVLLKNTSSNNRNEVLLFKQKFLNNNYSLVLNQIGRKYVVNKSDTSDLYLSLTLDSVLDSLVLQGKFSLKKKHKSVKYIEHRYWIPQFQGEIYSEWIIGDKKVKRIIWGFVD